MGIHYGKADFITYGKPSLFLDFANKKSLTDRISGNNLITFTRTSTGTYVDEDGLIKTAPANSPRFDHDPVTGECLGLLIEEQRANLCTQSSNFNFGATNNITETDVFNPDGTAALRRVPLSTGNFHGTGSDAANIDITGQSVGGTTDVTTSIFVRNYNNSNLRLLIGFAAFDATPTYRYFLTTIDTANPTTLGIPSGTGWSNGFTKVDNYGNGWYRYTFGGRYTKAAGFNTIAFVGEQIFSSTGQQFWFGDDVSGIYIWGKQREVGLFSTSYIPTSGSTATRTPDNASITGTNFSSWYNSNNGTIILRLKSPPDTTRRTVIGLSGGVTQQQSRLIGYENGYFQSINDGSGIGPSTLVSTNSFHNGGVRYDVSADSLSVISNGGSVSTTTIGGSFLSSVSDWQFFYRVDGGFSRYNGTISKLAYYPTLLTDAQLQSITK